MGVGGGHTHTQPSPLSWLANHRSERHNPRVVESCPRLTNKSWASGKWGVRGEFHILFCLRAHQRACRLIHRPRPTHTQKSARNSFRGSHARGKMSFQRAFFGLSRRRGTYLATPSRVVRLDLLEPLGQIFECFRSRDVVNCTKNSARFRSTTAV